MKSKKWKIVAGVLVLFFALKWWFAAPSEAQLKARFVEHRAEFEELREMVQQDAPSEMSGLHISSSYADTNKGATLSPSRVERYRVLIENLGVVGVYGGRGRFRMIAIHGGFTDTSWSIGYSFSRRKPDVVVPSVYYQNRTAFAPLGDDWYLYNSR